VVTVVTPGTVATEVKAVPAPPRRAAIGGGARA